MSNQILGKILEELQEMGSLQKELFKIKQMFDWPIGKDGFVEHMREWKLAQPITNKSILGKLDDIWDLADDVSTGARDLENECENAQSAIEECSYYSPSNTAEELQSMITNLRSNLENSVNKEDESDEEGS